MRGSGPPELLAAASASSILRRSTATFSSRRSARSCWTSESDGLVGSFDIAAETRLKLAQAKVFHLAAQVASLDGEAADAFGLLERKAIELARIDEQADGELLALLLDHVLVTRHGAARDLDLFEAADPAGEDVDGAAHGSTEC